MAGSSEPEPIRQLEEYVNPDYGAVAYWDERFSKNAATGEIFEWLFDYASLKSFLRTYISPNADVLHVGCGNSNLAVAWCNDGHIGAQVNVDNSACVIKTLQSTQPDSWPNLRYAMGDVRCLSEDDFPSKSFDAVLDKATFDCIACNPDNQKDLEDMLRSIFRVLRPGGVYLLISCADPESRLCWLDEEPGLDWTVSVRHMPIRSPCDTNANHQGREVGSKCVQVAASKEVMVTNNDDWEEQLGTFLPDESTFVYVCRKY